MAIFPSIYGSTVGFRGDSANQYDFYDNLHHFPSIFSVIYTNFWSFFFRDLSSFAISRIEIILILVTFLRSTIFERYYYYYYSFFGNFNNSSSTIHYHPSWRISLLRESLESTIYLPQFSIDNSPSFVVPVKIRINPCNSTKSQYILRVIHFTAAIIFAITRYSKLKLIA